MPVVKKRKSEYTLAILTERRTSAPTSSKAELTEKFTRKAEIDGNR